MIAVLFFVLIAAAAAAPNQRIDHSPPPNTTEHIPKIDWNVTITPFHNIFHRRHIWLHMTNEVRHINVLLPILYKKVREINPPAVFQSKIEDNEYIITANLNNPEEKQIESQDGFVIFELVRNEAEGSEKILEGENIPSSMNVTGTFFYENRTWQLVFPLKADTASDSTETSEGTAETTIASTETSEGIDDTATASTDTSEGTADTAITSTDSSTVEAPERPSKE